MKKNFKINIKTIAMATAAVAMGACSDYSPEEYEGNLTQEEYKTIVEYTKNFEDRYGTMDPNQNWGFGDLEVKESSRSTRGYVNANSNVGDGGNWINVKKKNGGGAEYYFTLSVNGENIVVPGFPSKVDGLYHLTSDTYTINQMLSSVPGGNACGDVTNDEIVFVSRWFREHQNPENMSADALLANTDSKVTLTKAEYVGCKDLKLNTFFTQHISGDEDRNATGGYKSSSPGYGMDMLMAKSNVIDTWGEWNKQNGTHIYNFNAGSSVNKINEKYPDSYEVSYNSRGIQLYCGAEEEIVYDFCYHNSQDNQYYNRYAIMHLVFTVNGLSYDGYYLGFDYEKHTNGEWSADGYYNNWIVKISDALPKTLPDPDNTVARIICEDLGNTDDFDFNDLVFDVYYTKDNNSYTAHITVQAVGGTLPIYIGTDTSAGNELHYKMGYSDMKPINVGATGGHDGVNPCSLTVSNLSTTNPDDIIICVQRGGNQATPTILPKSTGTSSLAPQKICIKNGQGFKWMRESQQIETGYLKFAAWVENKSVFGDKGFWSNSTDINSRYLY